MAKDLSKKINGKEISKATIGIIKSGIKSLRYEHKFTPEDILTLAKVYERIDRKHNICYPIMFANNLINYHLKNKQSST